MTRKICTLLFTMLSFVCLADNSIAIIPAPNSYTIGQGEFVFNKKTKVYIDKSTVDFTSTVELFSSLIAERTGLELELSSKRADSNIVVCSYDKGIAKEGYNINITTKKIEITASDVSGLYYAFQSIRQLLPAELEAKTIVDNIKWSVPVVKIQDEPRFGYRGVMLDVARHFMPKDFMLKFIDLLSYHKINNLHIHLTDNQGWRVEIKKYPKLTEVGAFRESTIIGHPRIDTPHRYKQERYGGFYSHEDIKEMVAYASARGVNIIPEIDIPAHSFAALAAYPEYSCTGGPFVINGFWGPYKDVFCNKEETFTFLTDVFDELIDLFPSQYIHIGGDEVHKDRWERCHACQTRMEEEGLESEDDMQTYFLNRVAKHVQSRGRTVIGWDDYLDENTIDDVVIMSWRGEEGGIAAAQSGHKAIMAPFKHLYLDFAQRTASEEPLAQAGYSGRTVTIKNMYHYNPTPDTLTEEQREAIIGVESALWTEYVPNEEHAEYMLFPRVTALSELGWSVNEKDFDGFCSSLAEITKRYDQMGLNYCKKYID